MAAFIDILIRGLILWGHAVAIGGVCFALVVLRARDPRSLSGVALLPRSLRFIAAAAAIVVLGQSLSMAIELWTLLDDAGWPLRPALGTAYVRTSLFRIIVAAGLLAIALSILRGGPRPGRWPALVLLATLLAIGAPGTSHAAARLENRGILLLLDGVHQLAAALWLGGLVHLTAAAFRRGDRPWPVDLLLRFSALALSSVAVLVAAGVGLTIYYVGGILAFFGTAYGLMILTKVVILAMLLGLGALNFRTVRRLDRARDLSQATLRRFVEVEVGLGLTVLVVAASLTSAPPAADLATADRATLAEVATRFTPRLPALRSPDISEMPVDDPNAPRTAADRAWSEFNHHVSGIFVLAMGLLAMLHASTRMSWARHWPLIFLGLAAFMLVRNDPGAWPLGPQGFWEGWAFPSVVQHRVSVLLVVTLGIFEWLVRSGRMRSRRAALIFPLLCAVGGGLLLTHSHAALNVKEEFLIEATHAPLGVLALLVGWTRWLELRLPLGQGRLPGSLWPVGLALIGVLLIFYRET